MIQKLLQANGTTENITAKNITEIILDNISGEDLALTSGTIIRLIMEVFPKLPKQWGLAHMGSNEERMDRSLSIVQDFIEITSDLYHQQYAWDEMNSTTKEVYSPKLMQSNEDMSYR